MQLHLIILYVKIYIMYEGFKLKEGLALIAIAGLGATGLSGCGLSRQGSWELGVTCPEPGQKAQVNYVDQEHDYKGEAAVAISCSAGTVSEAPANIELLRGKGEAPTPPQSRPGDKLLYIYYTYEGGVFAPGSQRSPHIEGLSKITDTDTGQKLGLVSIEGVSHIDSAVTTP